MKKNRYIDSVTLMSVGNKVMELEGISNAEVQMGTWANQELLQELGYEVPGDTSADDLVLAVTGETEQQLETAFNKIEDILNHRTNEEEEQYVSLDDIDLEETPYDFVQISLPGRYVYEEADKALDKKLNVFIFSDDVSIEDEIKLKEKGRKNNLLVMGPDCGVAMVGGVCLGAGSIMDAGNVGIVAASGSGAQEVACLLEKYGVGISSLLGTGGRDLYPEIGGMEMIQAMEVLEKDPKTEIIVLVSKLADLKVMCKVLTKADQLTKPVAAIFLGSDAAIFSGHKAIPAYSLEEAARIAAELLGKADQYRSAYRPEEIAEIVSREMSQYNDEQKYFRGLYCGGTFTEESLIYYSKIPRIRLYSNLKTKYAEKLKDHHLSCENTILDLGAEDFTQEAPHPVFDPRIRLKRLGQELEDEETAVVLLDFITGPGVAEDPITPFVEIINKRDKRNHITFIANICGSKNDPQNIVEKKRQLTEAGVIVTSCSYESAVLAGALMQELERRK